MFSSYDDAEEYILFVQEILVGIKRNFVRPNGAEVSDILEAHVKKEPFMKSNRKKAEQSVDILAVGLARGLRDCEDRLMGGLRDVAFYDIENVFSRLLEDSPDISDDERGRLEENLKDVLDYGLG